MNNEKYYTPKIEEFHVGFEYEAKEYLEDTDEWSEEFAKKAMNDLSWFNDDYCSLKEGAIRVKYLDQEDIESLGFNKSLKTQWVGWYDYYSGNVSGKYGYYLYVTLHFPKLYNISERLEDNLFKIILHRYYVSNSDETTNIESKIKEGESEVVYKGKINNKSELKKLLKQLGI